MSVYQRKTKSGGAVWVSSCPNCAFMQTDLKLATVQNGLRAHDCAINKKEGE